VGEGDGGGSVAVEGEVEEAESVRGGGGDPGDVTICDLDGRIVQGSGQALDADDGSRFEMEERPRARASDNLT
jgi:hypothetical protein